MSKRSAKRAILRSSAPIAALALLPQVASALPASANDAGTHSPAAPRALQLRQTATALAATQQARIAALRDSAAIKEPVVWKGRLVDPAGKPSAGSVVAYLRPSGDKLSLVDSQANGSADAMIPIATATASGNGAFTLRASFDDTLAWVKASDGSFTIMLVASTNGAIGVEMNTMWWIPPVGHTAGTWATSNPALATTDVGVATAKTPAMTTADNAPDTPMRPFDLKMQPTPATVGASAAGDVHAAVVPPGSCQYWGGSSYPDKKAYIGLSMMQPSSAWSTDFAYTQTNTSSFQTGYTVAGGSHGLGFSVGGSETTSSTTDFGGNTHVTSNKNAPVVARHWITVQMHRYVWKCWNSPTPPPANPGSWPEVDTLEPGRWVRDFSYDSGAIVACNPAGDRGFAVGPHTDMHRNNSSSTTLSNSITGSIDVQGSAGNFSLSAHVQDDYARSNQITYYWHNASTNGKRLCGAEGPVMTNTRVVALS